MPRDPTDRRKHTDRKMPRKKIAVKQNIAHYMVRLPISFRDEVKRMAVQERRSMHSMMLILLEEALNQRVKNLPMGEFPFLDGNTQEEWM